MDVSHADPAPVRLVGRLNSPEAHILQDALAREGIRSIVRQDHLASADIPHPGYDVELWISPDALNAARAVLDDAQAHTHDTAEISCPSCGAGSPIIFAQCWKCDARLPAQA